MTHKLITDAMVEKAWGIFWHPNHWNVTKKDARAALESVVDDIVAEYLKSQEQ